MCTCYIIHIYIHIYIYIYIGCWLLKVKRARGFLNDSGLIQEP